MTEETKADVIKPLAAHGGSTRATCPWLLLLHVISAQVLVLVWYELLGCAEVRLETGWGCAAVSGPGCAAVSEQGCAAVAEQGCLLLDHGRHSLERRQSLRGNGYHRGLIGDCWHHYAGVTA